MKELPHTYSCFCCGEANAAGLRLRLETDGTIVQTHLRFKAEHAGFKAVVHGGLIATVLDEVMAWTCAVSARRFAYCAELTVRFLRPIPPGQEILAAGELVANRKNRVFETKGELRGLSGEILAEAAGKYLPLSARDLSAMATDLVGNADWLLESRD
jgi:acyl-coenzyme A thioesterase PaaI-like protein